VPDASLSYSTTVSIIILTTTYSFFTSNISSSSTVNQITVANELYHMKLIIISVINIILPLNYSCTAVDGGIFNIDVFYFTM
jgi:hypothetical protein